MQQIKSTKGMTPEEIALFESVNPAAAATAESTVETASEDDAAATEDDVTTAEDDETASAAV